MGEYQYWESNTGIPEIAGTDLWYLVYFKKEDYDEICSSYGDIVFDFSGLYVLMDTTKNRIYIGESSNVKTRIKQHIENTNSDLDEFDKISLIWDGRPTATSHLGNEGVRKSLEKECIELFKHNSQFEVVNHVTGAKKTNAHVESTSIRFTQELAFLLSKFFGNKGLK